MSLPYLVCNFVPHYKLSIKDKYHGSDVVIEAGDKLHLVNFFIFSGHINLVNLTNIIITVLYNSCQIGRQRSPPNNLTFSNNYWVCN